MGMLQRLVILGKQKIKLLYDLWIRVIKELQTRFNKFINGDEKALPPNLRHHAFSIVLRTSTPKAADFEKVLKIYKDGKSADLKLQALQSLGATNAMENVDRLLNEIVLDKEVVRPQDAMVNKKN